MRREAVLPETILLVKFIYLLTVTSTSDFCKSTVSFLSFCLPEIFGFECLIFIQIIVNQLFMLGYIIYFTISKDDFEIHLLMSELNRDIPNRKFIPTSHPQTKNSTINKISLGAPSTNRIMVMSKVTACPQIINSIKESEYFIHDSFSINSIVPDVIGINKFQFITNLKTPALNSTFCLLCCIFLG